MHAQVSGHNAGKRHKERTRTPACRQSILKLRGEGIFGLNRKDVTTNQQGTQMLNSVMVSIAGMRSARHTRPDTAPIPRRNARSRGRSRTAQYTTESDEGVLAEPSTTSFPAEYTQHPHRVDSARLIGTVMTMKPLKNGA